MLTSLPFPGGSSSRSKSCERLFSRALVSMKSSSGVIWYTCRTDLHCSSALRNIAFCLVFGEENACARLTSGSSLVEGTRWPQSSYGKAMRLASRLRAASSSKPSNSIRLLAIPRSSRRVQAANNLLHRTVVDVMPRHEGQCIAVEPGSQTPRRRSCNSTAAGSFD